LYNINVHFGRIFFYRKIDSVKHAGICSQLELMLRTYKDINDRKFKTFAICAGRKTARNTVETFDLIEIFGVLYTNEVTRPPIEN